MIIELSPTTVGIALGVCLGLVRLIPVTKPWWSFLPEQTRFLPPLVVVLAGLTAGLITDPASYLAQLEVALPAILGLIAPGALQSGASHDLAGAQRLSITAALKAVRRNGDPL
jgi:hypothetical protein